MPVIGVVGVDGTPADALVVMVLPVKPVAATKADAEVGALPSVIGVGLRPVGVGGAAAARTAHVFGPGAGFVVGAADAPVLLPWGIVAPLR